MSAELVSSPIEDDVSLSGSVEAAVSEGSAGIVDGSVGTFDSLGAVGSVGVVGVSVGVVGCSVGVVESVGVSEGSAAPITGTSSASLGFVPTLTSSAVAIYVDEENHSLLISSSPSYTSLYVSILAPVFPL